MIGFLLRSGRKVAIMTTEQGIEDILNTLGDKEARRILAAISREARSAKELANCLDFSLPTVYRRLELLREQELIKDRTELADDGNHYNLYVCNFSRTILSLDDGEFEVQVYHEDSPSERLNDLWDDLEF